MVRRVVRSWNIYILYVIIQGNTKIDTDREFPAQNGECPMTRRSKREDYLNIRLRTCSKIRNKPTIKKNQPSHAMTHGRTKLAMLTPTHTARTQLLPRHGTLALTVITCKTHSMKIIVY